MGLGPDPVGLGLSPPSPFPWLVLGVPGFTGVEPNPWLCDPAPYSLLLASTKSSHPFPPPDSGFGKGAGCWARSPK